MENFSKELKEVEKDIKELELKRKTRKGNTEDEELESEGIGTLLKDLKEGKVLTTPH